MSWPRSITDAPLTQVMRMVPASGHGEEFPLPECQICGCIIAGYGHDEQCGDQARAYLDWALRELMGLRVRSGLPPVETTLGRLRRERQGT